MNENEIKEMLKDLTPDEKKALLSALKTLVGRTGKEM